MNRRTFRSLKGWALSGAAVAAFAGAAHAEEARRFDIPRQDLVAALEAFGKQGDKEILFSRAQTEGRATAGVAGDYEPGQALGMLLSGSGLNFRQVNANTFVVEAVQGPQGGSAGGDVDALIVTAQKREENIQDVPIAISAFSQEDLTRSQVAGGPDLMTQVPNFTFTKTNFSSYSIQIRGIGTQAISATTDAAVAVAMNNTPFIRNRFFEQEFYDLQRVEVLRGPQGTLYGRNATAGVVNIITAKPKFVYEAKVSADVANYNSTRIEGMINLPLVEDVVAIRLAGAWTKRDGFVTNEITGNPIDGRDLWSTRASLRFAPNDAIDVNLIWEHFEEDDDRLRSGKQLCNKDIVTEVDGVAVPNDFQGLASVQGFLSQGCKPSSLYSPDSFQTPNGYSLPYYQPLSLLGIPAVPGLDPYLSTTQSRDLRVIESTVDPHYSAETDVVELQFSVDLGNNLTLSSETGYLSDTLFSTQDFNRFNTAPGAFDQARWDAGNTRVGVLIDGVFCDPQIGCADRLVATDLSTDDSHHFSQEFRLSSDYDGPFNFSLGANFLRYDTEDKYYVFINTLTMYALRAFPALPPYTPNVSDNRECLTQGFVPPVYSKVYTVNSACIYVDPNPVGSLNDQGHNYFLSRNPYKLISYAAFGEAYYNITDNLKLTVGARWTVDKKEAPRIPSWVLAGGNFSYSAGGAGYAVDEVIEQEWREPTGRLTLDWKPDLSFTDETLLYASLARGYKAGGANPPPAGTVLYEANLKVDVFNRLSAESATKPKIFDPEFVNAFEIGAKNTFLDGRMTVNTAAFYYDYSGYQISQIVDRSATNMNFDAKVWGLEIEADWRPLENLRLGFKGGYEHTEVADGEQAIDLMDRTAGNPDWVLVKPFPSLPSNCILPISVINQGGVIDIPGQVEGGNISGCELAYTMGLDPLTGLAYVPDPTAHDFGFGVYPGYAGFNPLDESQGHNGGAGFYKQLGGNELPNAPNFTATITADYTLPLPNDWLVTLHTDLYYQSEAWTRIFNTEGYDKLKAYSNINLAAIFANEDAGWRVMAYIKNVLDRDSITGAFLNSDDTGLTTNVFLTEPRLYGVRITKDFTGSGWWTGANPDHPAGEPYPLTLTLGGQVHRLDAPFEHLAPDFVDEFSSAISPTTTQDRDLDTSDGREVELAWRPAGSAWSVSAGARFGRANTDGTWVHLSEVAGPKVCGSIPAFCNPALPTYNPTQVITPTNWSDSRSATRESYDIVDFTVGKDVGLGALRSTFSAGLRYASFDSTTDVEMDGITNMYVPPSIAYSHHDHYTAFLSAERRFEGAGPVLSWEGATRLFGGDEPGRVDLDWTVTGGVLFGKQKTRIDATEGSRYFGTQYYYGVYVYPPTYLPPIVQTPIAIGPRSESVTAPLVEISLGLSYEIQRVKVSAGYRWERYFDVLDAGYDAAEQADRTIDGPYFRLSVGFGG